MTSTRNNPAGPLLYDTEIERTARRNNAATRRRKLAGVTPSSSTVTDGVEGHIEHQIEDIGELRNPINQGDNPEDKSDSQQGDHSNSDSNSESDSDSEMANNENIVLKDVLFPALEEERSPVVYPDVEANNFELKPGMIQWAQACCNFHGLSSEDANEHLRKFKKVCNTFKIHQVSPDAIKLGLFPFTLENRASAWLDSLPNNSIRTWNDMRKAFLTKYFPASKATQLRNSIMTFK